MPSVPFVTCLILTRNRRPWLPYALRCAQYQTYSPREILVVSDGESVDDLILTGVRHLHLPGNSIIGAKRNAGCAAARGEIVAFFDDDDYSHPERVASQVRRLLETGAQVTGYQSMRFTDGLRWWLYSGTEGYAVGTSLCFYRSWWAGHPFSNVQVGEDKAFTDAARPVLVTADAGEMMWATNHGGNTSPRNLKTKQWKELPCA